MEFMGPTSHPGTMSIQPHPTMDAVLVRIISAIEHEKLYAFSEGEELPVVIVSTSNPL